MLVAVIHIDSDDKSDSVQRRYACLCNLSERNLLGKRPMGFGEIHSPRPQTGILTRPRRKGIDVGLFPVKPHFAEFFIPHIHGFSN